MPPSLDARSFTRGIGGRILASLRPARSTCSASVSGEIRINVRTVERKLAICAVCPVLLSALSGKRVNSGAYGKFRYPIAARNRP